MARLFFVLLAGAMLFACTKENGFELPIEYQTLAIKLGSNKLGKKTETFNQDDSLHSFFGFNFYLKRFAKAYPAAKPNTPEHLSLLLMRVWNAMDASLKNNAPAVRDSLDTDVFFNALIFSNQFNPDKELLDGASFDDYAEAYIKCLPYQTAPTAIRNRNDLHEYLRLDFRKPLNPNPSAPGEIAFTFIRARIR